MPNTQAAKKALRQNISRRKKNISRKNAVKVAVKDFKKSIAEGNKEKAQKQLSSVYKVLDKTAKKNVIKKNKASRMKSRLSKQLKKLD